ncbi:MAG: caspase family protein [Magnetococcales bacterium]|nr:caspase family protein [Nitrospirota bacterium]
MSDSGAAVPQGPILRIETGMHTAAINRIAVDYANLYLVTASDDKTVRVWELSTGRLIRTLRPPTGDGNEGKMYSVAISPDGKTIACGGWTGYQWDGKTSIYLFDRESGDLTNRVSGLPNVINHLAYSKDGRYLAVALGGDNGIRIFNARGYTQAAEDKDYDGNSCGLDFDPQGRLAAVSYDGYIRLYDSGFKLQAKEKAPGGNQPFSVSFSADGGQLAVGFRDSTKVDVLSGKDLSYLYSPDTTKVDNGDLHSVAWSRDGRYLYAGGQYDKDGQSPILMWSDNKSDTYQELPGASNIIMQILPLNNGGIAFGADDPAFGTIDKQGERTVYVTSDVPDYRGLLDGFLISNDGATVRFAYEQGGKSPAVFDLSNRLLDADGSTKADDSLKPPITLSNALKVTDWENTVKPQLNGTALKLREYEMSRSLAIELDGEGLLLGNDWSLRLFDKTGTHRWEVPAPGVTWSVNISGNGKLAVAAFGDGTIRWYRLSDGRELLAFFPHNDKKRWVLWTPSGYYDASTGGDELIGWHFNNGKDKAADFYPVSKFKSTYYRPDVISKVLQTLDVEMAAFEQMLPPVVSIISPPESTEVTNTNLTIRYAVRTPSDEPVTEIKVLVDGRPVTIDSEDRGKGEVRITIPQQDCEVTVIADNKNASSVPATARLKWKGAPSVLKLRPKLYILAVGVNTYHSEDVPNLSFAVKDAKDFVDTFELQNDLLYSNVVTKVLKDDEASKDNILDGFNWILNETTDRDVAMIFISGHGKNDRTGYYYLPVNTDINNLIRTGVSFSDIKKTVTSIAGKSLLFLDTCHAGNVLGTKSIGTDLTGLINELISAENGVVVFASSTGRQKSLERSEWSNGAFTKALVEGLNGKAALIDPDKITIDTLGAYISDRVKKLTAGKQTPTTAKPQTISDFPFAVKR